jgi:hypothetical protein
LKENHLANLDTVKLLLAAGARADAANQQSCLQVVVSADHMEAAKLLLDAGAAGICCTTTYHQIVTIFKAIMLTVHKPRYRSARATVSV